MEKQQRSGVADQETGVSRHHGRPIEGLPESPRASQDYHIEGFMWGPLLGPHYAEISFFQSGSVRKIIHVQFFARFGLKSTVF